MSFGFRYFGHFSCVIFFPLFSVLPILPWKMKTKITQYFRIFVTWLPKVTQNQNLKMGWTKKLSPIIKRKQTFDWLNFWFLLIAEASSVVSVSWVVFSASNSIDKFLLTVSRWASSHFGASSKFEVSENVKNHFGISYFLIKKHLLFTYVKGNLAKKYMFWSL